MDTLWLKIVYRITRYCKMLVCTLTTGRLPPDYLRAGPPAPRASLEETTRNKNEREPLRAGRIARIYQSQPNERRDGCGRSKTRSAC